jgi:thiol-disulfide isomerase/thioredoxin
MINVFLRPVPLLFLVGFIAAAASLSCARRTPTDAQQHVQAGEASGAMSPAPVPPSPSDTSDRADRSPEAGQMQPDSTVTLTKLDGQGHRKLLQGLKGNVVLVDFWATWCMPCMQQFPHSVQLSEEHRDKGLRIVSVSMDEPSDEAKVLQFLRKQNARFDNVITTYGVGAEFADAFEIRGDVPFYKLYDRTGRLRYQFSADPSGLTGGERIDRIDQRVTELLAE